MPDTVILTPAMAVEHVCHDEQMQVWAHDILTALGMGGILNELEYEEIVEAEAIIRAELKSVLRMAFDHPEARTLACPGNPIDRKARLSATDGEK